MYSHCTTLAEAHAQSLVTGHGANGALNIARRKIEDAPFLVNGDLPFWTDVLNAIVGNRIGAPVK